MELKEGSTVWLAWTFIEIGARKVVAYVTEAVVINAEARLIRAADGQLRQMYYYEEVFATEAEARSFAAAELEAAGERVTAAARAEREKAAAVTAKGAVVYA